MAVSGDRGPRAEETFARSLVESGVLSGDDLEWARSVQGAGGETLHLSAVLVRKGLVTERQISEVDPALAEAAAAGRSFASYELLEILGRGGMGVVWKARDQNLRRVVALKLLSSRTESPLAAQRFRREARAAARLAHPAIVRVYDADVHDGQPYLATEFIDGRSLGRALDEGMPRRKALGALVEVARGLQVAHDQGIVHRDVKPDNILIDREGRAHLVDFGLAKEVLGERPSGMTSTGCLVGTPFYMSPEQADGKPGGVGPASDQYSLGVVVYRVLAGRLPFEGPSLRDLLLDVWNREHDPPSRFDGSVGPALDTFCLRALAKAPEDRFPSMGAFADDLERRAASFAGAVTGARRSKRLQGVRARRGPSHAVLAGVAAALLGLGVIGGVWLGRSGDRGPPTEDRGSQRIEEARELLERAEEGYRDELADAERVLGDSRAALEEVGEVTAGEPGAALGRFVEGWASENLGWPERAESSYRAALRLDPALGDARVRLSLLLATRSFLESTTLQSKRGDGLGRALELAREAGEIAAPAATTRSGRIARDLAGALVAFAEKDFDGARRNAREGIGRHGSGPGIEWLHWMAGLADHGPEGLPAYDQAIALRPHFALARFCRGMARTSARDSTGALADYEDAIRFQPRFTAAYLNRAALRHDRGDLEGAFADYGEALRIEPALPTALCSRAVVRIEKGDAVGAEEDLREAIRIAPDSATAHLELGQLQATLGRHEAAIGLYGEALRIDPESARAHFRRANSRGDLGDAAGALADYDRAIELDPRYAQAYVNRASILLDRDELGRAGADLDEAIRLRPDLVAAWVNRGLLRDRVGETRGALDDFNQAIRLDPRSAAALVNRGSLLRGAGAMEPARRDFDAAILLEPGLVEAWYNRAHLRRLQGDLQGTLADLTEVVRLSPRLIEGRLLRASVLHELGRYAEAIVECEEAIRLDPREPQSYSGRGANRERLGDRAGAIADYERCLALAPGNWDGRREIEGLLAKLRAGE